MAAFIVWGGNKLPRSVAQSRVIATMERIIEPELLDELEPADPRAIHSRRDLRRINYWMGNQGHIHKQLLRIDQPRTILEIGAGDGTVMARVAKKFGKKWKNV